MNYQSAVFEMSAGKANQLPLSDLPEIVFSGKSNVGKSSLINKLLNRKSIARVSATPGKTTTINFFKMKDARFVDLPGYGYAKVSNVEKQRWSELIEGYFSSGRNIKLVIEILDIRHEPTAEDFDMINYLIEKDLPFMVVCTKKDKLNKTQLSERVKAFHELFDENDIDFICFSSSNGEGVEELKKYLENAAQN
ncbi:MAG: YihA family ribosome biogenesis GTP-binding protein [Ruminococcaceae bacterium]|nr:YihA family ribosome biogenesis GTP-binding protein [Oscillospiraceae bacterium]